ncbi:hypothetical protein M758_4G018500 [Ceratodon purpureus]|uniref:Late embryogenesis abundant protein LEA-2 subgroup domain-containing protein n=1 Tax=Ceratodon purpureus TaxID=3225 RepID=A0A8T0I4C6_CERPU|nr:hypothetical protein KC19_4G020600 [Ceratodon purpureus]KAG0617832.1 hypothetical protein M758_4G018500 [Ceratodon purpureus]
MATKFMSNMSRTFSNSGFSRTYSSAPKPFHFTKLHQGNMTPLPAPATQKSSKKSRSTCMAVFCCCFTGCISMLITAAIGLGIAALIIWLVLRPIHMPTYDVRDVRITKFDYTASKLNAAATYTVVAYNGNGKIGIKYDNINIDTSYQGQVFDHTVINAFYHGHRENKTLPMSFTTPATGFALDATKGTLLQADIVAQRVPLLMRVDVPARLKIGAITTPRFNVHVNCDVVIKPATATTPVQVLSQSCRKV